MLEKSYIGSGAAGRNTTIIRANYRTPEGAAFYKASVKLYEGLAADLDFNLLFSQQGHLTLAHSERSLATMTERAEVNQLLGIDSRLIGRDEIRELCPELDLSDHPTWPIMGALYHPPGGIIRHDAVVWGYARGADRGGVEIHQNTEVTGITQTAAASRGVRTNRGDIACDTVISATSGWSTLVCDLAGVRLPITTHILQAFVTEPVKPFLDVVDRVVADARLRLADRPRRVPDRRRDRAVHDLPRHRHVPVPRVLGAARAGALPAARARQRAARVDGPVRPVARLQPDPRHDRGGRASTSRPAGAPTASRPRRSSATTLAELVADRAGRRP